MNNNNYIENLVLDGLDVSIKNNTDIFITRGKILIGKTGNTVSIDCKNYDTLLSPKKMEFFPMGILIDGSQYSYKNYNFVLFNSLDLENPFSIDSYPLTDKNLFEKKGNPLNTKEFLEKMEKRGSFKYKFCWDHVDSESHIPYITILCCFSGSSYNPMISPVLHNRHLSPRKEKNRGESSNFNRAFVNC